ncbi:hypothetical protein ACF3DV_28740 [Chlorogloeopsis fritschii PCC 9212]|uniref:hypothetical protein n=1 Tax=Chlorogloeopsis fritschii TaxID=1124 RepID=UPI00370D9E85
MGRTVLKLNSCLHRRVIEKPTLYAFISVGYVTNLRLCDRIIFEDPEKECCISYHFHFSGTHEDKHTSTGGGQYIFHGSGLAPKITSQCYHQQPYLEIGRC